MRKRTAIIISVSAIVMIGFACTPSVVYRLRERQFVAAQSVVQSSGGYLNFDLVDGNYMLELDNASDTTVERMIETLRSLPTGFTLLGPGEERGFWIMITDSSISDAGLATLCDLPVTYLSLSKCPRLTDASATRLSKLKYTYVSINGDVPFSEDAWVHLRSALGDGLYPQIAEMTHGEPCDAPKDRASRFDNGNSTAGPR